MTATRINVITLSMAGTAGIFHHATEATLAELLIPTYWEQVAGMMRQNDVVFVVGTHLPAVPLRVAAVDGVAKRVMMETAWTPPAATAARLAA
jgi:hypothetical protein